MTRDLLTLSLGLLVGIILAPVASAQQTTGVPGLPSSTTTIDGRQIPPPPGTFGGTIATSMPSTPPHSGSRRWCRQRPLPTFPGATRDRGPARRRPHLPGLLPARPRLRAGRRRGTRRARRRGTPGASRRGLTPNCATRCAGRASTAASRSAACCSPSQPPPPTARPRSLRRRL